MQSIDRNQERVGPEIFQVNAMARWTSFKKARSQWWIWTRPAIELDGGGGMKGNEVERPDKTLRAGVTMNTIRTIRVYERHVASNSNKPKGADRAALLQGADIQVGAGESPERRSLSLSSRESDRQRRRSLDSLRPEVDDGPVN